MDDLLMNVLVAQMAKQILEQQLIRELTTPACNICEKRFLVNVLRECAFCEKIFCPNCCGKEGTVICKICNWALAQTLSFQILDRFCIKELRLISDNYKLDLYGIREKRDLIEAILRSFKKSIEGSNESIVNVEGLKMKMLEMKIEEENDKEMSRLKAIEGAKLFENLDRKKATKEPLTINFKYEDHVNLAIEDIPKMSVKEIKCILDSYKVDYSFAIEKKELVDLAIDLTETYNAYRAQNPRVILHNKGDKGVDNGIDTDRKFECIVCMNNKINAVFLNCAHSNCCYECALEMDTCPICRSVIEKVIKIFYG